jgi:carbonic anhydrase/acetyltransferase-like protein (isoleucine patch superfamily)
MKKNTTNLLLCTLLTGALTTATACGTNQKAGEQQNKPAEQNTGAAQPGAAIKGPVVPENAKPDTATFIDPTATLTGSEFMKLASKIYIAPFAKVVATKDNVVTIGDESDLQDNTVLDAGGGAITLGERSVIAHGGQLISTKKGQKAAMGTDTKKPDYNNPGVAAIQDYLDKHPGHLEWGKLPSFIGFNSVVDGATMSDGSMVTHLAKVDPGILLKTGLKVLPGKHVKTQEEADDPTKGKVAYMTADDMAFMVGVVEVNVNLARGYTQLYQTKKENVYGINWDPGTVQHNMEQHLPTVGGQVTAQPNTGNTRFRIIGDVKITDIAGIQHDVSLRADEGPAFTVGSGNKFTGTNTFHALEGSNISVGNGVTYGKGALVHGGSDSVLEQGILTKIGDNCAIGDGAVVFKSTLGAGVKVGERALVMSSDVPAGTQIPAGHLWIDGKDAGTLEW